MQQKKKICVAALAVFDDSGRVLLARRGPQMKQPGMWEFPGGKIEEGETEQQCLTREWQEEFSAAVKVDSPLSTDCFDYGDFIVELRVWRGRLLTPQLQLHEHDEIAWYTPEKIPLNTLAPADHPAAMKIMNRK